MPFGLTNAPQVFQKLMNKILGPVGGEVASAYLDDIICPAQDFKKGIENLGKVLKILKEHNLTLNPSKCYFFMTSIKYLGMEINKEGVRPGENKMKAIRNFPIPKNVQNDRQFLGLTGFFRRFIKDYALESKPLSILLKKDEKFLWENSQETAFGKLKEK